jgi:hypothetical protein
MPGKTFVTAPDLFKSAAIRDQTSVCALIQVQDILRISCEL